MKVPGAHDGSGPRRRHHRSAGPDDPGRKRPPRRLRTLLGILLPVADRAHLLAEVDALYAARRSRWGRARAVLWYARTVAGFGVRLAREALTETVDGLRADRALMVRLLLRRKGFAAATVFTLAVGLAGVTTVYAIADWVLLRPVPGVRDVQELFVLRLGSTGGERPSWAVAHADFLDFRRAMTHLADLEASRSLEVNLLVDEELPPMRVEAGIVTSGWFDLLGVAFAAGRALSGIDAVDPVAPGEAVLDHSLARVIAPDARGALGRTIIVNGNRFIVVGVTDAGFRGARFPGVQRIWLGTASLPVVDRALSSSVLDDPYAALWDHMVGRLNEGASLAAVEGAANAVLDRLREGERPNALRVRHFTMQVTSRLGLDLGLQGTVGRTLVLLACAAAFLLLLAITNVANLGLTHAASRGPEFAVQRALGIGRGRLLMQVLTQYLLIGVLAGGATIALLAAIAGWLRGIQLDEFGGSLAGFVVQPRVTMVAGAVAALAGLLAGLGPTVLVLRQRVLGNLRGAGDGPRAARRVRHALVLVQVAVSTMLLVGAGLMARTLLELHSTDLGFDPDGVVSFTIDPESQGYASEEIDSLLLRVGRAIEETPGVTAGFVFPQPLRTSFLTSWLSASPDPEDGRGAVAAHVQVSGAFLDALGARVIAGTSDLEAWSRRLPDEPATVVISRAAAEELLPGRALRAVPGTVVWEPRRDGSRAVEIAAVVEDIKLKGPSLEAPPVHFWPWGQAPYDGPAIAWVRGAHLSTAELARRAREAVEETAPATPAFQFETVEQRLATISATQRIVAGLVGAVSVLGLLLAAIGLYGMLAYGVTERRREIGIRAALGAEPGELRRLVLRGGVVRVIAGIAPGLLGAVAVSRWLESLLFGVRPFDVATYAASVGVLILTALAASWLPAHWAASVSPADVLRVDT